MCVFVCEYDLLCPAESPVHHKDLSIWSAPSAIKTGSVYTWGRTLFLPLSFCLSQSVSPLTHTHTYKHVLTHCARMWSACYWDICQSADWLTSLIQLQQMMMRSKVNTLCPVLSNPGGPLALLYFDLWMYYWAVSTHSPDTVDSIFASCLAQILFKFYSGPGVHVWKLVTVWDDFAYIIQYNIHTKNHWVKIVPSWGQYYTNTILVELNQQQSIILTWCYTVLHTLWI